MTVQVTREERKKALKSRISTDISTSEKGGYEDHRQALKLDNVDVSFWKPADNDYNTINIVPYLITTKNHPKLKEGYEDYVLDYWRHIRVGAAEDTFVCLKRTFGKPCPICEEYELLRKDSSVSDTELKALKPTHRTLYNVINVNDAEAGIQLFEISWHLFQKNLAEASITKDGEVVFFSDIDEGQAVSFKSKRSMHDGKFPYYECKLFSFEKRKKAFTDDILKESYSLDSFLDVPTYDEVRCAFLGIDPEDEDESNKDSVPERVLDLDSEKETPAEATPPAPRERKRIQRVPEQAKEEKNKCPHGHIFGVDSNTLGDCAECTVWDECMDEMELLDEE